MRFVIDIDDDKVIHLLRGIANAVQGGTGEPDPETESEKPKSRKKQSQSSSDDNPSLDSVKEAARLAIDKNNKEYVHDVLDYFEVSRDQTLVSRRLSALPEADYEEFMEVLESGIPEIDPDEVVSAFKAFRKENSKKAVKKLMKKFKIAGPKDIPEMDVDALIELQDALL